MHILIIGAAGMVGAKLAARLAKDGAIGGKPIDRLTLVDVVPAQAPAGVSFAVATEAADLSNFAAGIVVGKMGAVAIELKELKQAIGVK